MAGFCKFLFLADDCESPRAADIQQAHKVTRAVIWSLLLYPWDFVVMSTVHNDFHQPTRRFAPPRSSIFSELSFIVWYPHLLYQTIDEIVMA